MRARIPNQVISESVKRFTSHLIWAVHLGAITGLFIAHAPVLVAEAHVVGAAGTVAAACVWADGRCTAEKRKSE